MRSLILNCMILITLGASAGMAVEPTFCSPCEGTGRCHLCGGDGRRNDRSRCSWCNDCGKCYYCDGRGSY